MSAALFAFALAAGAVAAATRRRLVAALAVLALVGAFGVMPHTAMVEKLATRLVLPVGALWLLGYGALLVALATGRRRGAAAGAVLWLAYTLAGSGQLGGALVDALEAGYSPAPPDARFDAVLVLGGGTDRDPDGGVQLSYAGDRLRVGAALWHRGQTPLLVAAGTSLAGLDQAETRDLGGEARALWGEMGVPPDAVLTLPGPHNTATEIDALAARARAAGWRRIGLVTSAWHLRRATRLAVQAGLDVVPIAADRRGGVAPWSAVALVPTGSGFYQVGFATKEWIGAAFGR